MQKKLFLLLIFVCQFSFAQKHEFLKIPNFNEADLSLQKSSIDPDAPAEYLYRSVHTLLNANTGFLEMKYVSRIKIYDKDRAEDYLNLEIRLWDISGKRETIDKMKAFTYNLEGGKVVKTKVDASSKYKSKENDKINVEKFAFPNVKNGSIIEYEYTVGSPYYWLIPEFVVEMNIPSKYTEFVIDHPLNVAYNINFSGELEPKFKRHEDTKLYDLEYRTIRMGFENVIGFVAERFVKNTRNYRTKISAELNSTNFGDFKSYARTWDNIKEQLLKDENFGGELKKMRLVRDLLPAEARNSTNKLEKANIIFEFVQKNYTWNNKLGVFTKDGIKNLLDTKVGNAAEINLLLVMLFREAELEAYPMVLSTVNSGLLNVHSPNQNQLNMVIAVTKFDKLRLLYDATSKQSSANNLPPRDWNTYGVLLMDKGTDVLQLNNVNESINTRSVDVVMDGTGSFVGTYSDKDTGAYAMFAKDQYDENPDKYKKVYQDNYSVTFSEIATRVNPDDSFETIMKFSVNNAVDMIGKKMIFNPLLFLYKNSNEFDQKEERRLPVEFYSPFVREKIVTITLPEGYRITNQPQPKKIVTQDKEIQYSYSVEQKGNKLIVSSIAKVASDNYPKEYYPAFKQIWDAMLKSENQLVTLEKQ